MVAVTHGCSRWILPRIGILSRRALSCTRTYLCNKLNTELHGKTLGIEGRNGLELYRQVAQAVDQIPENAKFLMGADLSGMVQKYGGKIKDLKTLYGVRLLLKKRSAEFKKVIGEEVDTGRLQEIIWNVMDPVSKMTATQQGKQTITRRWWST